MTNVNSNMLPARPGQKVMAIWEIKGKNCMSILDVFAWEHRVTTQNAGKNPYTNFLPVVSRGFFEGRIKFFCRASGEIFQLGLELGNSDVYRELPELFRKQKVAYIFWGAQVLTIEEVLDGTRSDLLDAYYFCELRPEKTGLETNEVAEAVYAVANEIVNKRL